MFLWLIQGQSVTGSAILQMAYGYRPADDSDELMTLITQAMEEFSAALVPGAFLVDFIPLRKSLISFILLLPNLTFHNS